jgi:hypothetical protein
MKKVRVFLTRTDGSVGGEELSFIIDSTTAILRDERKMDYIIHNLFLVSRWSVDHFSRFKNWTKAIGLYEPDTKGLTLFYIMYLSFSLQKKPQSLAA